LFDDVDRVYDKHGWMNYDILLEDTLFTIQPNWDHSSIIPFDVHIEVDDAAITIVSG